MGFLLWACLTALAFAAGWALAIRFAEKLRIGEMLVGACIGAVAIVLAVTQAVGYASILYPWTVALGVLFASGGIIAWARPTRASVARTVQRFRSAARASLNGPGTLAVSLVALAVVVFLAAYVYLMPSWAWDAMWYHDAISAYAYQEHSLLWVPSWIPFVNSYPKGVELLSLWNALFAPDDRLLDAAQLPLVLMGAVAIASMCRNAGAKPALAWGLGLVWLLMPAVFLNTPTNYNDAGAASLWLAAVLFLARMDSNGAHRLFGALALGAYAGAKVSGLLHTLMILPVVLLALGLEWRRTRRLVPLAIQTGAAALAIFALGGASYLRDLVKFGNPFWPAQVPIPLTHQVLPGTWRYSDFNTPPFGGPDDFHAMLRSFATFAPGWQPDVRLGGFGSLWLFVLLPLALGVLVFAVVQWRRKRPVSGAVAVALLLVTACATPARWWPRYTLGFPAAGLLAAAMVIKYLPRAWMQQSALFAVGIWAAIQGWPARTGFFAPRDHEERPWSRLIEAARLEPAQRSRMKFDNWQQPGIALRDRVVQPGEASAYDVSTSFVYQLWRSDWKNRVLYLPLEDGMDPAAWLALLDREKVRWASFGRNSRAAQALQHAGWTPLWACGAEGCGVWLRPGTVVPGLANAQLGRR
jgi:hypothetical protein